MTYTDSADDTQADFTRNFPDPGFERKPPNGDTDPGIVNPPSGLAPGFARDASGRLTRNGQPPDTMFSGGIPGWREPRSPMAGPHPADSNWDRFLFALSGPESSFGRNQVNRTSSARGWLQDIAGTRNQMMRQGLGDPWAGGRQNQFAVNRRYIERNFPQAAQAIARGDWNTAIRILAPNQWPSLPGGPQSTPQGVAMFNRALQRGPPQAFLGNPYPASPSDYGQPDSILKTAQSTPGLGPPGYMPQPNELTGVLQQAMNGLMQNGSGRIAPMSLATLQFYANYLIAQRKGQTEAAKIQHARFQDQFKETLNAQQIELGRMGSCFSEAEKTKDPIGEFKQCMAAYSDSPNDPALQRALQGPNSWAQVKALLDWRHDNWLKGSKVKSQSDKQSDVWGSDDDNGGGGGPSSGDQSSTPAPSQTTPAPSTSATPAPTAPAKPLGPDAIRYGNNDAYNQEVTSTAMTGQTKTSEKDPRHERIVRDSDDLLSKLQTATANLPSDQIAARVSALNPEIGDDLQNALRFGPETSRTGAPAGTRSGPYARLIAGWARRITNNQWSPERYQYIQRALNDYRPGGAAGQAIYGTNRLGASFANALKATNKLDPTAAPIKNGFDAWVGGHFSGDPRWRVLYEALNDVMTQSVIIQRAGRSAHSDIENRLKNIANNGTPEQIREVLKVAASNDVASLDSLLQEWNNLGQPGTPDGYIPASVDAARAVGTRLDAPTGRFFGREPLPPVLHDAVPGAQTVVPGSIRVQGAHEGQTIRDKRTGQQYIIRGGWAIPFAQ